MALRQVRGGIDRLSFCIDEHDLLAGGLHGRHLQRPSQPVRHRERRLHVPGIVEVKVVVGDSGLVECCCERRIQRQVVPRANVCLLGVGYDSEQRSGFAGKGRIGLYCGADEAQVYVA